MAAKQDGPAGSWVESRWLVIQSKLARHAAPLTQQGVLVAKQTAAQRKVWVVRFLDQQGGRAVHRSIYIGDHPELVRRARQQLEQYRAWGQGAHEVAAYARWVTAVQAAVKRALGRG
jgi:hypothetical protein